MKTIMSDHNLVEIMTNSDKEMSAVVSLESEKHPGAGPSTEGKYQEDHCQQGAELLGQANAT